MKECTENEIAKLQRNLTLIRNAGGWSMREFGEMLGVTKQTVCNLEKGFGEHPTMSKTQYIAIRSVLDSEINENPDNELLQSTVNLCLNSDYMSPEDGEKIKAFVMGGKKTGMADAAIVAGIGALLGIALPLLAPAAGTWIKKIVHDM